MRAAHLVWGKSAALLGTGSASPCSAALFDTRVAVGPITYCTLSSATHVTYFHASLLFRLPIYFQCRLEYQIRTKTDLQAHSLANFATVTHPPPILAVVQNLVQELDQRRNGSEKLTKCLRTVVNVHSMRFVPVSVHVLLW
jgi:hypothetical protein